MTYEFKVNELAKEFGVHRNTIRNWIKSGAVKAESGPGRQYIMQWNDYIKLCEKFGRKPRFNPNQDYDPADLQKISTKVTLPPIELEKRDKTLYDLLLPYATHPQIEPILQQLEENLYHGAAHRIDRVALEKILRLMTHPIANGHL